MKNKKIDKSIGGYQPLNDTLTTPPGYDTPKQTPKTMEAKYRISFRHNDGKRTTIFADDQADLIYKLSHLEGEVLLIDTEKQTPKADSEKREDVIYLDINDFAISEQDLERAFCFGWLSNPENDVMDNVEMMRRYEIFKTQYLLPMLSRKGIID